MASYVHNLWWRRDGLLASDQEIEPWGRSAALKVVRLASLAAVFTPALGVGVVVASPLAEFVVEPVESRSRRNVSEILKRVLPVAARHRTRAIELFRDLSHLVRELSSEGLQCWG